MSISELAVAPFLFACLISSAITYLTIVAYRTLGLVDRSTSKDHAKNIHSQPVPRGGGIPIFLTMLFAASYFLQFDTHITAIFAGALILSVLGVLDDLFNLSPYLRLIAGIMVATLVVSSGIGIAYVSNPMGGILQLDQVQLLTNLATILWITWAMNFVNMGAKGLDGQLPGVVVVASLVMGILSFRFVNDITTWPSAYLAFSLAGAYLGFLFFNFYPQRIMPGWGGGVLAGYFLAILSILSGSKLATALIVLGVPLADVVYAVLRRLSQGKSPVWGDDRHLHHLLLKLGWSKRQVALSYTAATAILGFLALQLNSQFKAYTIVLTGVVVGGVIIWINLFLSSNRRGQRSGSRM